MVVTLLVHFVVVHDLFYYYYLWAHGNLNLAIIPALSSFFLTYFFVAVLVLVLASAHINSAIENTGFVNWHENSIIL